VISLRQHVVTIVAVFLALALGVLAGSAFVQPRLIESLETQVDGENGSRSRARSLSPRPTGAGRRSTTPLPHLTRDQLAGPTSWSSRRKVEDESSPETRSALAEAVRRPSCRARTTLAPQDEAGGLAEVSLTEPRPGCRLAAGPSPTGWYQERHDPHQSHQLLTEVPPLERNIPTRPSRGRWPTRW
jgi:hypothetical protein